jgi:hypothetical protein
MVKQQKQRVVALQHSPRSHLWQRIKILGAHRVSSVNDDPARCKLHTHSLDVRRFGFSVQAVPLIVLLNEKCKAGM